MLMDARNPITAPLLASLLRDGFEVQFEVTGSSMYPFICSGDRVRVRPMHEKQAGHGLLPGHIVLFTNHAGELCLHRVVVVSGGQIETQGDAVDRSDGYRPDSAVLGLAIARCSGTSGTWKRIDRPASIQFFYPGVVVRTARRGLRGLRRAIRSRWRPGTEQARPEGRSTTG